MIFALQKRQLFVEMGSAMVAQYLLLLKISMD